MGPLPGGRRTLSRVMLLPSEFKTRSGVVMVHASAAVAAGSNGPSQQVTRNKRTIARVDKAIDAANADASVAASRSAALSMEGKGNDTATAAHPFFGTAAAVDNAAMG